jgi:hypothetical protein
MFRVKIAECEEMRKIWRPECDKPAKFFITVVLEEHQKTMQLIAKAQQAEEQKQLSILFFDRVQGRIAKAWEEEIV